MPSDDTMQNTQMPSGEPPIESERPAEDEAPRPHGRAEKEATEAELEAAAAPKPDPSDPKFDWVDNVVKEWLPAAAYAKVVYSALGKTSDEADEHTIMCIAFRAIQSHKAQRDAANEKAAAEAAKNAGPQVKE